MGQVSWLCLSFRDGSRHEMATSTKSAKQWGMIINQARQVATGQP